MIEVSGLSKRYGNKYAVKNISFKVKKGEIVGLLGVNGAGKSTTMNVLTGYLSATEGSVKIHGYDILDEPFEAKKHIGYSPEIPPLYSDMTVKEYLNFIFELKKIGLSKTAHIDDVCDRLMLTDMKDRLIRNLSRGYKQRTGIAQAMIGNPDVLILDEPTVGLDPQQILGIRNIIRNLGKKHTVILSSHTLSEIQAVCDRIIVIHQGEIIANGTEDELAGGLSKNSVINVRIKGKESVVNKKLTSLKNVIKVSSYGQLEAGSCDFGIEVEKNADIRENLFYAMAEIKCPILSISSEGLTLEEIFLKLTAATEILDEEEPLQSDAEKTDDEEEEKN